MGCFCGEESGRSAWFWPKRPHRCARPFETGVTMRSLPSFTVLHGSFCCLPCCMGVLWGKKHMLSKNTLQLAQNLDLRRLIGGNGLCLNDTSIVIVTRIIKMFEHLLNFKRLQQSLFFLQGELYTPSRHYCPNSKKTKLRPSVSFTTIAYILNTPINEICKHM